MKKLQFIFTTLFMFSLGITAMWAETADPTQPDASGYVFYESFDGNKGQGGNDGQWSGISSNPALVTELDSWQVTSGYGANGCARFGTTKAQGSVTTPTIVMAEPGILSFRAGAWINDATTLTITISSGQTNTVEMPSGAFETFEIPIETTGEYSITFTGARTSGRFFLDEVGVRAASADTTPDVTNWYKVTVQNPLGKDGIVFWMSDAFDLETWEQPTPGDVYVDGNPDQANYVAYVRPGSSASLGLANYGNVFQQGDVIYCTSTDSRYDAMELPLLTYGESLIMNVTPESDITITASGQPSQGGSTPQDPRPEGWYDISVYPLEDFSYGFGPGETGGYGETVMDYTDANGIYHIYVAPGYTAQLWINGQSSATTTMDWASIVEIFYENDLYEPALWNTGRSMPFDLPAIQGDMTLHLDRAYYTFDLTSNFYCEALMDDSDTANIKKGEMFWDEMQNPIQRYYVRRKMFLDLDVFVPDTTNNEFLYWKSNLYDGHIEGTPVRTHASENNMTFKAIAWPKPQERPEGWIQVNVLGSEYVRYGAEEVPSDDPTMIYGANLIRQENPDGGMTFYVAPGVGFWLYVNNNYESGKEYDSKYVVRYSSTDPRYDGAEANIGSVLELYPEQDMTLTVDDFYFAYWAVQLSNNDNYFIELKEEKDPTTSGADRSDTFMEWIDNYLSILYVKKGSPVTLVANLYDTTSVFRCWYATVDYTSYVFSREQELVFTPESDMALWVKYGDKNNLPIRVNYRTDSMYVDMEVQTAGYAQEDPFEYEGGREYYVPRGATMTLTANTWLPDMEFQGWHSSNPDYEGYEQMVLECTVTEPMEFSASFASAFYRIELPMTENLIGEIETQVSEDGMLISYFRYEPGADGNEIIVGYVRKGYGTNLYLVESAEITDYHGLRMRILANGNTELNGKTLYLERDNADNNRLFFTPTSDMVISGRPEQANWFVELPENENWVNYEYSGARMDWVGEDWTRGLLVNRDSTFQIKASVGWEMRLFDHWTSSESRYNGDTASVLIITPQGDMTLAAVSKMNDRDYNKITLVADSSFAFFAYNENQPVITPETGAGLETVYEQWDETNPHMKHVYVRKGCSLGIGAEPNNVKNNDDYVIVLSCSLDSLNGKKLGYYAEPIFFTPTTDLTISGTLDYRYWRVTYPSDRSYVGSVEVLSETNFDNLDDSTRVALVEKGDSLKLQLNLFNEELALDYWSSGSQRLGSEDILTVLPEHDMTINYTTKARYTYHTITLAAPDENSYYELDYPSGVNVSETSDEDGTRYVHARQGTEITVQLVNVNILRSFVKWQSGVQALNNATENPITLTVTEDADLQPVFEDLYWRVAEGQMVNTRIFLNEEGNEASAENVFQMEEMSPAGGYETVWYVRKGATAQLHVQYIGQEKDYTYYKAAISSDNQALNGRTIDCEVEAVTFTPTANTTISAQAVYRYWEVEVTIPDTCRVEVADSTRYNWDEEEPSLMLLYVEKGKACHLTYTSLDEELTLDHWTSSDTRVNGDTAQQLIFTPQADMTLSLVTKPAYTYYTVTLTMPDDFAYYGLDYEGRVEEMDSENYLVHVFRAREGAELTFSIGTEDRIKGFSHWTSDQQSLDGFTGGSITFVVNADVTVAPVFVVDYWRVSLREPEEAWLEIYPTAESDREVVFEDEDEQGRIVYILKGETVEMFVPFLNYTSLYHFGHWTSSNDSVEGRTDYPLLLTPTSDMTLGFVLEKNQIIVGNDTIVVSDTISAAIDIVGDGTIMLELENEEGVSTMTLDSAKLVNAGLSSDLTTLVLDIVNTSVINADNDTTEMAVGISFAGDSLIIQTSTELLDTTFLLVAAENPIVGNGVDSKLTIAGRVVFTSSSAQRSGNEVMMRRAPSYRPLQPAITGFSQVNVVYPIELMEVWYPTPDGGQTKGDPTQCIFNASAQTFGEVDMDASSFTPATTLVFSDGAFYTDYLEGNIDIETGMFNLEMVAPKEEVTDPGYYDVLGRPLDGPCQGIYIHEGRVYLMH